MIRGVLFKPLTSWRLFARTTSRSKELLTDPYVKDGVHDLHDPALDFNTSNLHANQVACSGRSVGQSDLSRRGRVFVLELHRMKVRPRIK